MLGGYELGGLIGYMNSMAIWLPSWYGYIGYMAYGLYGYGVYGVWANEGLWV